MSGRILESQKQYFDKENRRFWCYTTDLVGVVAWSAVGGILVHLWNILESSWGISGNHRGISGHLGGIWGCLGVILESSWGHLAGELLRHNFLQSLTAMCAHLQKAFRVRGPLNFHLRHINIFGVTSLIGLVSRAGPLSRHLGAAYGPLRAYFRR